MNHYIEEDKMPILIFATFLIHHIRDLYDMKKKL